jgi:hypothetical protein
MNTTRAFLLLMLAWLLLCWAAVIYLGAALLSVAS